MGRKKEVIEYQRKGRGRDEENVEGKGRELGGG